MTDRPHPLLTTPSAVSAPVAQRVIGPVRFECVDQTQAIEDIEGAIASSSQRVFAFCNMHTFNLASRSKDFAVALGNCTVYNDGVGIDVASKILFGSPFPSNLNGTDLTSALLANFRRRVSVYLVGSAPGVAQDAAMVLATRFPQIDIVGATHGFITESENDALLVDIRNVGADLILVGMGNPRQEFWALDAAPKSEAVILCVGAYIDFIAGRFLRAPVWIRKLRCEWAFRLALEPTRLWRRYLVGAPLFLRSVFTEKITQLKEG